MKTIAKTALAIVALAIFAACFYFGMAIPFADQWPLFEALRTTASIVFAVAGAWITVVYPAGLQNLLKNRLQQDDSMTARSKLLVRTMTYSMLILASVLVVGIAAKILAQIACLVPYRDLLRGLSFGLLGFLTYAQLGTLFLSLMPGEVATNEIALNQAKNRAVGNISIVDKSQ